MQHKSFNDKQLEDMLKAFDEVMNTMPKTEMDKIVAEIDAMKFEGQTIDDYMNSFESNYAELSCSGEDEKDSFIPVPEITRTKQVPRWTKHVSRWTEHVYSYAYEELSTHRAVPKKEIVQKPTSEVNSGVFLLLLGYGR